MANSVHTLKRTTVDEYLAIDDGSPSRHEFVDGVIYAMGGATDNHGRIAGNIFGAVLAHLPDRCDVFMGDMRLSVPDSGGLDYYYPDILVSCSDLERASVYREHPILLIEVLSPSSGRIDRSEKFGAYTQISSLQEYVIVGQDVPQVDVFRRRDGWRGATFFREDEVTFESIELTMKVVDIYRRVLFGGRPLDGKPDPKLAPKG